MAPRQKARLLSAEGLDRLHDIRHMSRQAGLSNDMKKSLRPSVSIIKTMLSKHDHCIRIMTTVMKQKVTMTPMMLLMMVVLLVATTKTTSGRRRQSAVLMPIATIVGGARKQAISSPS